MRLPALLGLLGVALAACAGERRPPAPPPLSGHLPVPPATPGEAGTGARLVQGAIATASATATATTTGTTSGTTTATATGTAPGSPAPLTAGPGEDTPAPRASIAIEPPFRLDQRVIPSDKATFLADLRERTRWNQGGMGTLAGPLPPVTGHPLPKVIVDVTQVGGPHPAADVQRTLRKVFWGKVVECYGLGAYKDQKLRGKTTLNFRISRTGKVSAARAPRSTLNDLEVVACLAEKVTGVELPRARAASQATVEIQVGPGDEPMPPPASLLTPGDGTLLPEAIRGVIVTALPAFEACYRPALAYAPALWGRLGIRFHLTERGKLDEAFEVESRFPDERVTLCVLRATRALSFPKPAGGDMRFIVPLRFWSDRSPESPSALSPEPPALSTERSSAPASRSPGGTSPARPPLD